MAHRPCGLMCCAPCPSPSLYRWPGGCLGRNRGGGVPLGLLLPKGDLPTGESYSKEDCNPTWSRIAILLGVGLLPYGAPHPMADLGSLGGLPPKARGVE